MAKYHQGTYPIKNKQKYIGKKIPFYRSGWEYSVMSFFDNSPSILQWASESIAIPYHDPLTNKTRNYIPDFFIVYIDANGMKHAEIIEVKPSTQTGQKKTKSAVNHAHIARNQAKWAKAIEYCQYNGLQFRIITENEIWGKR